MANHFDKLEEFRDEREKLKPKFAKWVGVDLHQNGPNYLLYKFMAEFFNFRTNTMGILSWEKGDEELLSLLKLLNGPNGHTIFKMKQINDKNK